MTRILTAAALALALPLAAAASPTNLPELTFPEPVAHPDVSTQGCTTSDTAPCR
ncbi:hypothetical protein [Ponticoccus alexandrii]|uniref:Uncharacterized protein n=1 Tax=Ponticoccus alexandrii TaxID=1943633 RepID=A0ABX7F3H8_9RHOB|nr:hypothetical protein [Ponticoccus alexandrii]QRF65060.1 hypothetical protein GQA70_01235 [Ponticoccus alexandrii]